MPVSHLPDFDQALDLGDGEFDASGLAEVHGVACGLLLHTPQAGWAALQEVLAQLEIKQAAGADLEAAFTALLQSSAQQLADSQMGLELWLPDDSEPLSSRTAALGQWCSGFMAALGVAAGRALEQLSDEGKEALADVGEIAKAEIGPPMDALESEEDEQAFAEIVEYLRIAVLIVQEDLRVPEPGESLH
jgi:uncharacterized protein YgfB (UPF0149 family)